MPVAGAMGRLISADSAGSRGDVAAPWESDRGGVVPGVADRKPGRGIRSRKLELSADMEVVEATQGFCVEVLVTKCCTRIQVESCVSEP